MTRTITNQTQTVPATIPPVVPDPVVDERQWQAWMVKNKRRDKESFSLRLRFGAILGGMLALGFLIQRMAG